MLPCPRRSVSVLSLFRRRTRSGSAFLRDGCIRASLPCCPPVGQPCLFRRPPFLPAASLFPQQPLFPLPPPATSVSPAASVSSCRLCFSCRPCFLLPPLSPAVAAPCRLAFPGGLRFPCPLPVVTASRSASASLLYYHVPVLPMLLCSPPGLSCWSFLGAVAFLLPPRYGVLPPLLSCLFPLASKLTNNLVA